MISVSKTIIIHYVIDPQIPDPPVTPNGPPAMAEF
jgi:hypothetical protein